MKILIITGIFPPDIGGPATYVPTIAEALLKKGHEIKVITLSESQKCNDKEFLFNIIRINRNRVLPLRMLNTLFWILRIGRHADILFVNGLAFESAMTNLVLRKPLVNKIVGDIAWERSIRKGWTEDNIDAFQASKQCWKAEVMKIIRSWQTRRADLVITPSKYLEQMVRTWKIPSVKIRMIYNAVEQRYEKGYEDMNECERKVKHKTPSQEIMRNDSSYEKCFKILTAGRLIKTKGIDLLIEALTEIPAALLTVVGEGPYQSILQELVVKAGVSARVIFTGALDNQEVKLLMEAHDIFILLSQYEGLPHVVIEAMHCGMPVIATRIGGLPEVVRNDINGYLIDYDKKALLCIIDKLYRDRDLLYRLSEGAKSTVDEKFRLDTMIEETEQNLIEIVAKKQ